MTHEALSKLTPEGYEALNKKMHNAFKLVEPAGHWKNPVLATVTLAELATAGTTVEEVCEAVVFFTGTACATTSKGGAVTFSAPGYYAGPCN